LRRTRSVRFWSSVCMPILTRLDGGVHLEATLASRIRLRMALVAAHDFVSAMRPGRLGLAQRLRDHGTAIRRAWRAPSFPRREDVDDAVDGRLAALERCAGTGTRWPVSAAVMARRMVSRSRISPTRMASGPRAQRRAAEAAHEKRQTT